jgi:hypothetical protein
MNMLYFDKQKSYVKYPNLVVFFFLNKVYWKNFRVL